MVKNGVFDIKSCERAVKKFRSVKHVWLMLEGMFQQNQKQKP
jgi:hypothetical protein